MDADRDLYPCEAFLGHGFRWRAVRSRDRLRKKRWLVLGAAAALGILLYLLYVNPTGSRTADEPNYAWVQMMPDRDGQPGGRLLRAIMVDRDECPAVRQGGRTVMLHERPPTVQATFPVLLCETMLDADTPAQLGSWHVPIRPVEPNDIVVIGDTGCRMTYYSQKQSCLDRNEWPFGANAAQAAMKVSGASFVLHLGDFHYREHPCADTSTVCGGSPYGDNWETWKAEFFEPAASLLRAAPWVIMRGNHESCKRAGAGWLFFFGMPKDKQSDDACESSVASYSVSIGKTAEPSPRPRVLFVMDTADADESYTIADRCKQYAAALKALDQDTSNGTAREIWLALHQPLWSRGKYREEAAKDSESREKPDADRAADCAKAPSAIAAIRNRFETEPGRSARLVLSGDTHAFQFFLPSGGKTPIQIIAGNGGTELDTICQVSSRNSPDKNCARNDGKIYEEVKRSQVVTDDTVQSFGVAGSGWSFVEHGFTVMHRDGATWTATELDSRAGKILDCRFSESILPKAGDPPAGCDRPKTGSSS
jgi:Calcineurin-like phosphoesterase